MIEWMEGKKYYAEEMEETEEMDATGRISTSEYRYRRMEGRN